MDAIYLERLTPTVQALVRQVESDAGISIGVVLDPSRAGRGPYGEGILACNIDKYGATVLIPSADFFPEAGVVHEMLHIRRCLVEGVPRISDSDDYEPWSPQLRKDLTRLDNSLEHLVIVREEIHQFPPRREYWSRILERTFGHDLPAVAGADERRRATLPQWAFVDLVLPGSPAKAVAQEFLKANGLLLDAQAFVAAIKPALPSKPDLVRAVFVLLKLAPEMAVLEYLDSRRKKSWEEPL